MEEKEHKAAERDFWDHQRRMDKITLAISVAVSIAAFASVFISIAALRAAVRAANEANRQANAAFADQRPWLRPVLKFKGLQFQENTDAIISYEVQVTNTGRSPAHNVKESIWARILTEENVFNTVTEQKHQCNEAAPASEVVVSRRSMPGAIIFPNESAPLGILGTSGVGSITLSHDTYSNAWPSPTRIGFQIIGCFDYLLPSGEHGQSGFAYLLAKELGGGHQGGFAPVPGSVPNEQIAFYPDPFSGGYFK